MLAKEYERKAGINIPAFLIANDLILLTIFL